MLEKLIQEKNETFSKSQDVLPLIEAACKANSDVASYIGLGKSEEGRDIYGAVLGRGPRKASLIAGSHADEPAGPETLRTLILQGISEKERLQDLFDAWTFFVVPQVNPDGEYRNRQWVEEWPSLKSYMERVQREPPGRDIEFGYPDMRVENLALTRFWEKHRPFHLHISFHGMGYAEGALLLIERHWIDRTEGMREIFINLSRENRFSLHDHNRKGEKGFYYIGPGFSTTPEGKMMRFYFESAGDRETAVLFRDSSMEWVRSLGGNPLCLVTEIPLFVIEGDEEHEPGVPGLYNRFTAAQPDIMDAFSRGEQTPPMPEGLSIRPVPVSTAVRMHLGVLESALTVTDQFSDRRA